jgi:nucleoside-diphosphate-sugar epimerase
MRVLITGSQGFIGSYVCSKLLEEGCHVVGVDNFSKYGKLSRQHDTHPNFKLYDVDASEYGLVSLLREHNIDIMIAGAAMIGGISYFHEFPYALLAENDRIIANTYDAAILYNKLKRVVVLSSSMVYESATEFPVKEEDVDRIPAPLSSYGFQKLAVEYYAKAAYDQFKIPYTIIRPFNCVGVGEDKAIDCSSTMSGNIKLTLSHVLPDLIIKVLNGQDPLHILGDGKQVRCFTNGKDIARGIWMAMTSDKSINESFNISVSTPTPILQLAELVWRKIRPNDEFRYVSDKPFQYDVQFRLPDTTKAERVLGFKAEIGLEESVDEVINYIKANSVLSSLQTASS